MVAQCPHTTFGGYCRTGAKAPREHVSPGQTGSTEGQPTAQDSAALILTLLPSAPTQEAQKEPALGCPSETPQVGGQAASVCTGACWGSRV